MTPDARHFLLRKLHSLSGVVPVGLFLLQHIYHNAYAIQGREAFGKVTAELQGLPVAIALEIGLIWLPILFHGLYGFYVMFTGRSNATHRTSGRSGFSNRPCSHASRNSSTLMLR